MVTATAAPTTDELNGMLQQQTPVLISANVIAQQFAVEPQQLIDYCTTNGIFVAPLFSGGEYMVDFNNINEGFVRDFTTSLMVKTLEPQVQERLQAIASLRGGNTVAEQTEQKKQAKWKTPKKGATMREMVVNLIATNDPAGDKGFLESLRNQDERATALVSSVIEKHYNNSTRSKNSLLKEITKYLGELSGAETAAEVPVEKPAREKRTRKTKTTEQAAA